MDEYINRLSQCKYWFKLALTHAYHQLELDEESRRLNTMSKVWRNIRMKRLSTRILNALDFYDERMYHLLHDIKNTASYRNDITGRGKTLRSMIKTLSKVLQRLKENGLTLSPKKCPLAMKSVEFLGYVFTQDGLKPSPDKVKVLEEAEPPESKEALKSFLGMVGWNQRFIERFSEMSAILYNLNEKGSFKWKDEHQQAFHAVKRLHAIKKKQC